MSSCRLALKHSLRASKNACGVRPYASARRASHTRAYGCVRMHACVRVQECMDAGMRVRPRATCAPGRRVRHRCGGVHVREYELAHVDVYVPACMGIYACTC